MIKLIKLILVMISMLVCMATLAVAGILEEASPSDQGWPRVYKTAEGITNTVYQPQLDTWDGYALKAYAAVAVQEPGVEKPIYGVAYITAHTIVDKGERLVHISDLTITGVQFPLAPEKESDYLAELREAWPKKIKTVSLDRLEASLEVVREQKKVKSLPLRNNPPRIIFSTKPSILVYIDGEPHFSAVKGTSLSRVLNTRVLMVKDNSGRFYLHVFDGYMEAPSLHGPWTTTKKIPKGLKAAENAAQESQEIDLMEGQEDPETKQRPTIAKVQPEIFVSTTPAELITTDGPPNLVPLEGTRLLYVQNTSASVFKDTADQKIYVLISGRWFKGDTYLGPWNYVPARELPKDFADIPEGSPKENVKASVPGTPQAEESLIADTIPQTSKVDRKNTTFEPEIDGEPQIRPIENTSLSYVVNSPVPLIKVNSVSWYACENGVWFTAVSVKGPWKVAVSVPAVIYSIPPGSPLYYVTYVRVYNATPDYVYCGYTPGYYGCLVSPDYTVVYGTGYYYDPWIGSYWWGPPVTYGCGSNPAWTPWSGWSFTFGFGWGWGPFWYYPPAPWWGPFFGFHEHLFFNHRVHHRFHHHNFRAWGAGGWASTQFNVYQMWGKQATVVRTQAHFNAFTGSAASLKYGRAYNSTTGALIAGHKGAVQNVFARKGPQTSNTSTSSNGLSEARKRMRPGGFPRLAPEERAQQERKPGKQPLAKRPPQGNITGRQPSAVKPPEVTIPEKQPPAKRTPQASIPAKQQSERKEPSPSRQPPGINIGRNNTFATPNGNVFQHQEGQGKWQQVNPSPKAPSPVPPKVEPRLERERAAREIGQQRTEVFQAHKPSEGSPGKESKGGSRGGGMIRH